jgi:hypothetical protein
MKLYVWQDVLTDYTSGVMFALADNEVDAREQICPGWHVREAAFQAGDQRFPGQVHVDLRGEPTVFDTPVGFAVWGGA